MTISVPLKDEVTATLRAETSACTDSLAPGCCSRLISSTLLSGLSLATGGGAGGFLRCALPDVVKTTVSAVNTSASIVTFTALPGVAQIKNPLPRWLQRQCRKPHWARIAGRLRGQVNGIAMTSPAACRPLQPA